jgi:hypothetical protein
LEFGAFARQSFEPERHGGEHSVFVIKFGFVERVHARLTEGAFGAGVGFGRFGSRTIGGEGVEAARRQPVSLLGCGARAPGVGACAGDEFLRLHRFGHLGQIARGRHPETLHVNLFVRRIEAAAFHPTVPELRVFDEAVGVRVGRFGEAIGF